MLMSRLKRFRERLRAVGRPAFPADTRVYAVGDVHGRLDLLERLGAAILEDTVDRPVGCSVGRSLGRTVEIFLGDYVDRGASSAGVIDWLLAPPAHGGDRICLRGNHEQTMLSFLSDPSLFAQWSRFGGIETLMSYGVEPPARIGGANPASLSRALERAIPDDHRAFLEALPSLYTLGGYAFVHAGIRPGVPLGEQQDDDLLWIRDAFLDSSEDFGPVIVHGHTPVETVDVQPNRINIDTGAYLTHRLSCLVIEGDGLSLIQTDGEGIHRQDLVRWAGPS